MRIKAAVNMPAKGIIIEASSEKGLGTAVNALITKGTLKVGDLVLAGSYWGRIKKMKSDTGVDITQAGPSIPVQVCVS